MGKRQAGAPRIALADDQRRGAEESVEARSDQADGVDVLDGDLGEAVAVEATGGSP